MNDIVVKEVTTRKDLRRFVQFPDKLFKDHPLYIPVLHSNEMAFFNRKKNPAFSFCDARLWLAYKDGKIAGRVCGTVNRHANAVWNEHKVRFGWFDFIEDIDVCRRLIDTVADFGRQHKATDLHGPLGFTNMDRECWVIDNFDAHQNITTLYNPKYYIDFMSRLGFEIDCEWQQYRIGMHAGTPLSVLRVAERVKNKYNLHILKVTERKQLKEYGVKFYRTYNRTFASLYGFMPLPDDEVKTQINNYFSFLNLDLVKFVIDGNDDVVGFAVAFPAVGDAYRKAKGRLFPFGFIHILKALRKFNVADLVLIGVRPDWQHKGIHSLMLADMHRSLLENGCDHAYTNPQIATNEAVKMWKRHYDPVTPNCRRAVFSRPLEYQQPSV